MIQMNKGFYYGIMDGADVKRIDHKTGPVSLGEDVELHLVEQGAAVLIQDGAIEIPALEEHSFKELGDILEAMGMDLKPINKLTSKKARIEAIQKLEGADES